jgi:outer membrane protein TolC
MILALLASLHVAAAGALPRPAAQEDSIPRVTLEEALQASARLDPNYVAALGEIESARWVQGAAYAVFVLPALSVQTSVTKADREFFNIGTGSITSQLVDASVQASYDLFRGGGKLFELSRARAELEGARAGEVQARFASAVLTEADFYSVLAEKELTRVAADRVRRAEEQLAVARARVLAGAAVQTDSLQLLLELTRARVDLLRQQASLRVARVELGRRVGVAGPVDAAVLDTLPAPELPISEDSAVAEALGAGPQYRIAAANERAASAALKSARSVYLPRVNVFGQWQAYDDAFFPDATDRWLYGLRVSLPVWNDGQREIAVARARSSRDVARALLDDTEHLVRRDVIQAYQAYVTARASTVLAQQGVVVATENLAVQNTRYRAGATTILDLLAAQVSLSEAEAGLVQARQATRLALAGLEAVLGRRLFTGKGY